MEKKSFKYIAFISHKSCDEKYARWLQEKLASYKLPTSICKEKNLKSRKLQPCFRYQTDLGGADYLKKILEEKLSQSKNLIVICSPEAAQSQWVGDEVDYFVNNNLKHNIIPIVIKGTPYSNNELECLHPILKKAFSQDKNDYSTELACINLADNSLGNKWMKRDRAVARTVAKLTDIDFSLLWNWQRQLLIRKRIIRTLLLTFLLLFAFGIYDYNKISYEYFADYADHYGVPEGINPLDFNTRNILGELSSFYRFEFRRGKVIRVVHTNKSGKPIDHNHTEYLDRYAIQEIEDNRDINNTVTTTYRNAANEIKYTLESFQNGEAANIINRNSTGKAQNAKGATSSISSLYNDETFDLNTFTTKSYSTIGRYLYERDNGYISKVLYKRYSGRDKEPGIDANGISGIEYQRDSLHRIIKLTYLDKNGQHTENSFGISSKKYKYNNFSQIIRVEYLNKKNKLAKNELGWAIAEVHFSNDGKTVIEHLFDVDGNRCMSLQGFSKQIVQAENQSISISYYDTNDDPCILWASNDLIGGFHKTIAILNKNGRISSIKYYNKEDKPCYNFYGEAIVNITFDENGKLISRESCDINGNLKNISFGCAKFIITYDDISSSTYNKTTTYLGPDNNPINTTLGFASITESYHNGYMISRNYYDANNIACSPQINYHVHELRLKYDDDKNPCEISFWDANLQPAKNSLGFHKCLLKWNHQGHCESMTCYLTEEQFFNKQQTNEGKHLLKKCDNNFGYCTIQNRYDTNGRLTKTEFRDSEDNLVLNTQLNAASIEFLYNEIGQVIKTSFSNQDEQPCINLDGYAILRQEYDKSFLISSKYFDASDKPFAPEKIGAHEIRFGYNNADVMDTQSAYDENGVPTINTVMGCHIYKTELNNQGKIIKELWYDTNKKPINTPLGMASIIYTYDDYGFITSVSAFNANNEPSVSTRIGNAQTIGMGAATIKFEYDSEHRLKTQEFFDIKGRPMNNTISNIAKEEYINTNHHIIKKSYNKDGVPSLPSVGFNNEITLLKGKCIREIRTSTTDTIQFYQIHQKNATLKYIETNSSYKGIYFIRDLFGEPRPIYSEYIGFNKEEEYKHNSQIANIRQTIDSIDSIALVLKKIDGLIL